MKILTCGPFHYYESFQGIEPQFFYLCRVPESMGHTVDFLDVPTAYRIGPEHLRRQFLTMLRGGGYDAVFIATHRDEFDRPTLSEAKGFCPVIAWNSDDEWRWADYSAGRVDWYSFMVTNSPEVYAANKPRFPNLLHAQWACTGFWNGLEVAKDIDFSFVGQAYGLRSRQIEDLRRRAGLRAFGRGVPRIISEPLMAAAPLKERLRRVIDRNIFRLFPWIFRDAGTIDFEEVNTLWSRTRVSFTPLGSSTGSVLQIKSRVFDMGLSGTLMLASRGAGVERYYEPGKEFVEFNDLVDCAEKAKYYCGHEAERREIALAYARRTQAEHLWRHRIERVLKDAEISHF